MVPLPQVEDIYLNGKNFKGGWLPSEDRREMDLKDWVEGQKQLGCMLKKILEP